MNGQAKRDPDFDLACNGSGKAAALRLFSPAYGKSTILITGIQCSLTIEHTTVAPTPHLGSNPQLWDVLAQLQ